MLSLERSLLCVAFHLFLRTIASVAVFGGPEKGRLCHLPSTYFCIRLTGMKDGGADLLSSILVNNV